MKVTLTRNTIVAGAPREAGDVVDASDRDARYLVAIGKAVVEQTTPKKAKAGKETPDEDADTAAATDDAAEGRQDDAGAAAEDGAAEPAAEGEPEGLTTETAAAVVEQTTPKKAKAGKK